MARRRSWWRDEWTSSPRSSPRKAEGGIKSRSKRGAFAESWWAKRWVETLEGFQIGARLARGRAYARGGQVLSIAVEPGTVRASVQGSRPRPYDVTIAVKTLGAADWARVLEALGRQALFAAKLLAGEMPPDVETVFREVNLSLFPGRRADLKTACSCPDPSNPCKHVAAVYYLLGEEFDRDPFLIFTLRGLGRDALVSRLGAATAAASATSAAPASCPPEPLSARPEDFWGGSGGRIDDPFGTVEVPREPAALARRLGAFPFWQGDAPFFDALGPAYAAASARGLGAFLGPLNAPEPPAESRDPDEP